MRKLLLICLLMALCATPAQADPYYVVPPVNSANVVTATTTTLVTPSATQHVYIYYAGVQATGTNSANTVQLEYGTGAGCSTPTPFPGTIAFAAPASSPITQTIVGPSSLGTGMGTLAVPLQLPLGASLCGVTAGTTTSLVWVTATFVGP